MTSTTTQGQNSGPGAYQRTPPRRQKIAMSIAQAIVSEISERGYPAGTKLPAEKDMLDQYQTGRGTLRESLRFLELNGVITIKPGPGGGPVVASPDARNLASTLGLFLELHGTSLRAIIELRQALEPAMARQAAERADPEQVEAIAESVRHMEENINDVQAFVAERQFHHLIANSARNPIFTMLLASLDHIIDGTRVGVDFQQPRYRRAVLSAHQRIAQAIAAHDGDAAHAAMEAHVIAYREYIQKRYPQLLDQALRWADIAP